MIAGTARSIAAGPFGASLDLSTLNGTNGFVINGIDPGDQCGTAVSCAGDINGDGVSDLIISAPFANPIGINGGGECYVIFGGAGIGAGGAFDPSTLNGTNGFVVNGVNNYDFIGSAVSSAGDINGDGMDDLAIGAYYATVGSYYYSNEGRCFVVFGGAGVGVGGTVELSALNGTNGFVVNGSESFDEVGSAVSSAGDINGDGIDDLVIGAPGEFYVTYNNSSESYIIFGGAGVGAGGVTSASMLNGANGFRITNYATGEECGRGVSGAGDVNGDGMDDLIVGASGADPNGSYSGESYVIFGGAGVGGGSGGFDPGGLNGANGFVLNGVNLGDRSGAAVSCAGDFNDDGIDDLLIGANGGDPNASNSGETYLVFGGAGIGAGGAFELSSLNGANGFVINGIGANDYSGDSVSSAGDVNGDGVGDLIIGAHGADPSGASSGASYVVFGGAGVGASGVLELSALNGVNGFVINGIGAGDQSGRSVSSAGDVNGDGVDDLIIGASGADPSGSYSGASYVIFGRCFLPTDLNDDGVIDTADLGILIGQFGTAGPGADINGDGSVDTADLGILIGSFGLACP